MEIILWDFLMFYNIFLSRQEKRSAIISNKQGAHEFPHVAELAKIQYLSKKEKSGKSQNLLEL